jgi:hypothetical protein
LRDIDERHVAPKAPGASVGVLFLIVQFNGSMAVPEDQFIDYLRGRMADPSQIDLVGRNSAAYCADRTA